jgi:hypothetical protein
MAKAKSARPSWRALAGKAKGTHVEGLRVDRVDRGRLQPTVAAELRHQLAACGVDIMVRDRQILRAP